MSLKGLVYWSCARLVMLYGSETCLRENEMAILGRMERTMVRAMCGAKLMKKKRTEDLTEMLGLKETAVQMQRRMERDGTGMCGGGMMGAFWEKRWGLK